MSDRLRLDLILKQEFHPGFPGWLLNWGEYSRFSAFSQGARDGAEGYPRRKQLEGSGAGLSGAVALAKDNRAR